MSPDPYAERTSYYVTLSYATYAVDVAGDMVVDAPPIARWMIGKTWAYCSGWLHHKGGRFRELAPAPEWTI